MRLVVCIDRDDDLGRKAGVPGPVVGRTAVLDAAMRLGTVDPEDSDTNAMLAAVNLLDELRGAGEEWEVCVLTGSPKVGVASDRRVSDQFDQVLARVRASSCYLVSDGAEDEFLFPILASRIRVDGVRRVYVRQSASLESTYYTFVRALKDPKLRAKTVLPFAIVLLTLGIAAATGVFLWGIIGLAILLGVYLIFWTFDIDEAIIEAFRTAGTDARQGYGAIPFVLGLLSVAVVLFGFQEGYTTGVRFSGPPLVRVLEFLQTGIPWWVGGALIWEVGRATRRMIVRGRFPRGFAVAAISMIGVGFVAYAILDFSKQLAGALPAAQFLLWVGFLAVGIGLIVGAGVIQQYWKVVARRSAAEAPTSG